MVVSLNLMSYVVMGILAETTWVKLLTLGTEGPESSVIEHDGEIFNVADHCKSLTFMDSRRKINIATHKCTWPSCSQEAKKN